MGRNKKRQNCAELWRAATPNSTAHTNAVAAVDEQKQQQNRQKTLHRAKYFYQMQTVFRSNDWRQWAPMRKRQQKLNRSTWAKTKTTANQITILAVDYFGRSHN